MEAQERQRIKMVIPEAYLCCIHDLCASQSVSSAEVSGPRAYSFTLADEEMKINKPASQDPTLKIVSKGDSTANIEVVKKMDERVISRYAVKDRNVLENTKAALQRDFKTLLNESFQKTAKTTPKYTVEEIDIGGSQKVFYVTIEVNGEVIYVNKISQEDNGMTKEIAMKHTAYFLLDYLFPKTFAASVRSVDIDTRGNNIQKQEKEEKRVLLQFEEEKKKEMVKQSMRGGVVQDAHIERKNQSSDLTEKQNETKMLYQNKMDAKSEGKEPGNPAENSFIKIRTREGLSGAGEASSLSTYSKEYDSIKRTIIFGLNLHILTNSARRGAFKNDILENSTLTVQKRYEALVSSIKSHDENIKLSEKSKGGEFYICLKHKDEILMSYVSDDKDECRLTLVNAVVHLASSPLAEWAS